MSQSLAKKEKLSEVSDDNSRKAKQLPTPKGYKILITLPNPEEKTEGGIIKATETLQNEEVGCNESVF